MTEEEDSYLGLGFEGRFPVVMSESLDNRVVVVGRSVQKFTAHRRRPEHLFPALRVLVDVFSKQCQRLSLWVPETTAYTRHMSFDSLPGNKGAEGMARNEGKRLGNIPTKQAPGWKWT